MDMDRSASLATSTSMQVDVAIRNQQVDPRTADFGPFIRQEGRSPSTSVVLGRTKTRAGVYRGSSQSFIGLSPLESDSPFSAWLKTCKRIFGVDVIDHKTFF